MDIKISKAKRSKCVLFKEFEYIDLIPYSIALLMVILLIYFLYQVFTFFPDYAG